VVRSSDMYADRAMAKSINPIITASNLAYAGLSGLTLLSGEGWMVVGNARGLVLVHRCNWRLFGLEGNANQKRSQLALSAELDGRFGGYR